MDEEGTYMFLNDSGSGMTFSFITRLSQEDEKVSSLVAFALLLFLRIVLYSKVSIREVVIRLNLLWSWKESVLLYNQELLQENVLN